MYLKTEDELQQRVRRTILPIFFCFVGLYAAAVTIATWIHVPRATKNLSNYPLLWVVPLLNVLAVMNIPRAMHLGKPGYAVFHIIHGDLGACQSV